MLKYDRVKRAASIDIAALYDQLHNEKTWAKAAERLRALFNRIELVPGGKKNPDFLKEIILWKKFLGGRLNSNTKNHFINNHISEYFHFRPCINQLFF